MDKQHFDQLVNGVKEMKRDIAGKTVPGAISTELPVPDVHLIREAAHISQSQFAKLIDVNLHTQCKTGATSHPSYRASQGVAQNRGIQPQSH